MASNTCLDGFEFRADGFFFDEGGSACVLVGTVEFNDFWNAFDACFSSPLGRKLIYAATDAEECHLSKTKQAQFGKWFGRRRAEAFLIGRAACMGWGSFQPRQIASPAHDALTVGWMLAHEEHLAQSRLTLEWRQPSSEQILLTLSPNQQAMTAPPLVHPLPWLASNGEENHPSSLRSVDLDHRGTILFAGQAKSFFLPVSVVQRLVDGLRGRPATVNEPLVEWELEPSIEESDLFKAVAHASHVAYNNTDRPVYLQKVDDWHGHLSLHFSDRGFGNVEVRQSILAGDDCTEFVLHSHVPAMVAGTVVGMWCRAHGHRGIVRVSLVNGCLHLKVQNPRMNYE